jgi:anti-sigma B factor antagonist
MEGIQISVYYVGVQEDVALIQIGGYLDTVTSPQLETALEDVTTEGFYNIICDLGNVNYISSAGWGIFVSKIKTIRDMGGDLVLSQMIPDVFDVFRLLEFDRILKFHDSTDKAIKEFDELRGLTPLLTEGRTAKEDPDDGGGLGDAPMPSDMLSREPSRGEGFSRSMLSPTGEEEEGGAQEQPGGKVETAQFGGFSGTDLSVLPFGPGERNVLDRDLPLTEKVKLAVIDNPLAGINTIRRTLNSSRFGYVKIGYYALRKMFRELDLDSKEKRYRFWRSR